MLACIKVRQKGSDICFIINGSVCFSTNWPVVNWISLNSSNRVNKEPEGLVGLFLYLKSLVMLSQAPGSLRRSRRVSEAFFTRRGHSTFWEAKERQTTSKYSDKTQDREGHCT